MIETASEAASPTRFWQGHGLWRIPNFFRGLSVDGPLVGYGTAARLHYRRLTIERGARLLPPAPRERRGEPLPVYFMSGREHWAMTALCAYSLFAATDAAVVAVVMDDGTLRAEHRAELERILPGVQFISRAETEDAVARHLPAARFPGLHAMRRELPLMRKLMDLHAGNQGFRLFLDSDMLFFREPGWMLDRLRGHSARPFYMADYQNSYGYSAELLEGVLGRRPLPVVNTGICGLRSDSLDWERFERWAAALHGAAGTNHFSEQCLIALWMTAVSGERAPAAYRIWPDRTESVKPTAVMHHYVAESRTWYHVFGWPSILAGARNCPPATER